MLSLTTFRELKLVGSIFLFLNFDLIDLI